MPGPMKQFTELLPQVLVTAEQKERLYALARTQNKPVSDLVRDALALYLAQFAVAETSAQPALTDDDFPF